jgi:hypothetical protein
MIIAILGGEFSGFLPGTFQNIFMSTRLGSSYTSIPPEPEMTTNSTIARAVACPGDNRSPAHCTRQM